MRFGAHLSMAKGLTGLLEQAAALDATAIQIFARNPRGRGETKIPEADAAVFRKELKKRDAKLFIHAPYYVQMGSGDARNQRISAEVATADLVKGDLLGADGVVAHLGGPGDGVSLEAGTVNAIRTVRKALDRAGKTKCRLLLEVSAGSKRVGATFEQLRDILKGVGEPARTGICLDTCHLYTAGFDIRGKGATDMLDHFAKTIGISRLRAFHLNDTRSGLGSGLDRHWHIGEGEIGTAAFKRILRDSRLKNLDFMLETPKEKPGAGADWAKDGGDPRLLADRVNLARLHRLAGPPAR